MSLTATIATVAAAFLQPLVGHWLRPKQRLRAEITASEYAIPTAVSSEMTSFYYKLRVHGKPRPEFGEFLKLSEHYRSYFDVTVTNIGKTISKNVVLGCLPSSKYVLIQARNVIEFRPDQTEYLIGDLQPSEKVRCQIWSSSFFPTYDRSALEMFSLRDDHNSSKEIVLRRYYDRNTHYLVERSFVESLISVIKWTVLPTAIVWILIYVSYLL